MFARTLLVAVVHVSWTAARLSRQTVVACALSATALAIAAPSARADQVGTFSAIAGTGANTNPDQGNLGDGGPALSATMFQPRGIVVASDGTIYFADTGNFRVRRIRTDGVIETIAGTGVNGHSGDGGLAANAELSDVLAIALDPSESHLYLADDHNHAIRRVNLVTGVIEFVAQVFFPQGIAVDAAGGVLVSETVSCVIRRVDASTGIVTTFAGTGTCDSQPGTAATASFYFPTRLSIDAAGNVYAVEAGTDTVRRIDAVTTQVTTVAGGGSALPGSGPATSFNLGILTDVAAGGPNELFVSNATRVFRIDLATGLLAAYAGTGVPDFDDDCNGRLATACNLNHVGGLAHHDATGRLFLSDGNNARIRAIVPPVAPPSGGLSFIGTTATTIECPPGLQVVTGHLTISNNGQALSIVCPDVQHVRGDVTVINNPVATTIDLRNVQAIEGDLTVVGNGDAAVNLVAVAGVDGNLTVQSDGSGNFDAGACVEGGSNIDLAGYASVNAATAMGGTTLTMDDGSIMTIEVQPGTFPACVGFSVTRAGTTLETGTDADGSTATIDTLVTYQFTFAVPTLGKPAELAFDIVLSTLEVAHQAEVLAALASGTMTLVTKSDNLGATYQSFPVCVGAEEPSVAGCVLLQTFDANGNPTTGTPAVIRFTGVVGHFSTWAVAIVTPAPVFNGLLHPYPAPPRTTTPTFKRGSAVPLKFNWTSSDGVVIDSATASPTVTIYPGACSGESTTTPIVADDAGQSGGFRYDAATNTWVFSWSTKALAEGCYWIQINTGNVVYPPPIGTFPIALR